MSEVSSVSAVSGGAVSPATSAASRKAPVGNGGQSTQQADSTTTGSTTTSASISNTTQSYNFTSSSSAVRESSDFNQKMAALILALMEIILGLKDKDDEDKKALVGLAGLLAFTGEKQWVGEYQSMSLNQSSQVTQVSTTTNATAVQAGAYSRASGAADTSSPSVGGQLNVTG